LLFSNGNWTIPLAAWLAPVFLIHFVRSQKSGIGLPILFATLLIATKFMLAGIIPSTLGVLTYILVEYYAILWFLPYWVDRWLAPRLGGVVGTLVFPVAVVVVEYVNMIFFGSWASVAYTQFDNLPLIQIASITGMWGITFLVMWFGPVVNWILDQKLDRAKIRTGVFTYGGILLITLLYGGARLSLFPPEAQTIKVVSFTPTQELDYYNNRREKWGFSSSVDMAKRDRAAMSILLDTVHRQVFQHNRALLDSSTKISLWPEACIRVLAENEAKFLAQGQTLARENHIYLLMGYYVVPLDNPGRDGQNKAVMINPQGQIEWQYLKTHPVPGSTDQPGDGILPLSETPFGRVSTAICYDMDFTNLIQQAGKNQVDLMLIPAWDWQAIDPLHARMAVFRAIENGFSMVRQTGNGLSIAVDYQGRTLASMDQFTSDQQVLSAQIPSHRVRTIYAALGDWLAWLSIFGLIVLIWRALTHPVCEIDG